MTTSKSVITFLLAICFIFYPSINFAANKPRSDFDMIFNVRGYHEMFITARIDQEIIYEEWVPSYHDVTVRVGDRQKAKEEVQVIIKTPTRQIAWKGIVSYDAMKGEIQANTVELDHCFKIHMSTINAHSIKFNLEDIQGCH